jgi:hypothetical protein
VAAVRPLLTVLAAILLLAGCGGSDLEEASAPPADGVRELTSVEPLREAFNADEGEARLVLILSPT